MIIRFIVFNECSHGQHSRNRASPQVLSLFAGKYPWQKRDGEECNTNLAYIYDSIRASYKVLVKQVKGYYKRGISVVKNGYKSNFIIKEMYDSASFAYIEFYIIIGGNIPD